MGCGYHAWSSQRFSLAVAQLQAAFLKHSNSLLPSVYDTLRSFSKCWTPVQGTQSPIRMDVGHCKTSMPMSPHGTGHCGQPSSSREEKGRGWRRAFAAAEQSFVSNCIGTQLPSHPLIQEGINKTLEVFTQAQNTASKTSSPGQTKNNKNVNCSKKSIIPHSHFLLLFVLISLVAQIFPLSESNTVLKGRHNHILTHDSSAKSWYLKKACWGGTSCFYEPVNKYSMFSNQKASILMLKK